LASRVAWAKALRGDCDRDTHIYERYRAAATRILCPPLEALALTAKPCITGAVSMGCFSIPEYYLIPASTTTDIDLTVIQAFCDNVGYPLLVKGEQHGCLLCRQWAQVLRVVSDHSMCKRKQQKQFIQRFIPGALCMFLL
jgi:hypothetical protein